MRSKPFFTLVVICLFLFSCQKESSEYDQSNGQTVKYEKTEDPVVFFDSELANDLPNDPDSPQYTVELCATIISTGSTICRSDLTLGQACAWVDVCENTGWYEDYTIDGSPSGDMCTEV